MTTIERRKLGVTYYNEEKSARGFTLFAPQTGNGRVVLINMHGDVAVSYTHLTLPTKA